MTTCPFPYEIWLQTETTATTMTCPTSIASRTIWASHGNAPRTSTSVRLSPSLASPGILKKGQSHYDPRKRRSIFSRSRNGEHRGSTPWQRPRSSMGNYHMPPWLTQKEDLTSPTWKPSSEFSTIILTFLAPHPDSFQTTSTGGPPNSPNQMLEEAFQQRTKSMMSLLTQMQAPAQALESSSEKGGGPGDFSQVGTRTKETSGGPKPWASNSSHEPLPTLVQQTKNTSRSTEITKELSRVGREAAAETLVSTRFSNILQNSCEMRASPSTQDMFAAPKTLQTACPEAYTHQNPSSFPHSTFPTSSETSSSTTTILQMAIDARLASLNHQHTPYPSQSEQQGRSTGGETTPLTPSPGPSTRPKPRTNETNFGRDNFRQQVTRTEVANSRAVGQFPPNLTPNPSPLRPTCTAKDRLSLWKPATPSLETTNANPLLPSIDENRIREVLAGGYSDSTKATYGTGLLVFHVFCDKKGVEESQRTPCEQTLLAGFISTLIGDYSAQAIKNYTYGLRAWHIIHRIPWRVNQAELQTLFASAKKNQPPKSEKAQKPPCTIKDLIAIWDNLNLRDSFDIAVFACLTTTFWSAARLGELTTPKLDTFDPNQHVKCSNLKTNVADQHGNKVTTIFIPWTKASKSQVLSM
jgi:hypothetical protein